MTFRSKGYNITFKTFVFVARGLWTSMFPILEGPEAPWETFWVLKGGGGTEPSQAKTSRVMGGGSPGAGL